MNIIARGPARSPIADPLPVTVARWHLRLFSYREVIRQRRRDGLWTYLRTAPSPLEWDAARGTSSTVVSRPTCRPHSRSPNLPSHRKTERISRRTRTVSDYTLYRFRFISSVDYRGVSGFRNPPRKLRRVGYYLLARA